MYPRHSARRARERAHTLINVPCELCACWSHRERIPPSPLFIRLESFMARNVIRVLLSGIALEVFWGLIALCAVCYGGVRSIRFLMRTIIMRWQMQVPFCVLSMLGAATHIISSRRRRGPLTCRYLKFFFAFWMIFWPASSGGVKQPSNQRSMPAPYPPIPQTPSPPPSPPACVTSCLLQSFRYNTSVTPSQGKSMLTSTFDSTRSLPSAMITCGRSGLERLGPKGSFTRDTWPVLLLACLVALVAVLSALSPLIFRPVWSAVLSPLLARLHQSREHLRALAAFLTSAFILLFGLGIGQHAYLQLHNGTHTPLRAALRLALPFALCASLGRALLERAIGHAIGREGAVRTPPSVQPPQLDVVSEPELRRMNTEEQIARVLEHERRLREHARDAAGSTSAASSRRRSPFEIDSKQLCVEIAFYVAAIFSAALLATGRQFLLRSAIAETEASSTAVLPPSSLWRKAFRRAIDAIPQPLATATSCSLRQCGRVLCVAAITMAWCTVALAGAATKSVTITAIAALPFRGSRYAWQRCMTLALTAFRWAHRWKDTLRGGVLLVLTATALLSRPTSCHAPWEFAQLLARVAGRDEPLHARGWPLTRLLFAFWHDQHGVSVARGLVLLLLSLLAASGGVELICRDWQQPHSWRPLSGTVSSIRRFLAKPPPLAVKLARDGVAPLLIGVRLLAQHVATAPRMCPLTGPSVGKSTSTPRVAEASPRVELMPELIAEISGGVRCLSLSLIEILAASALVYCGWHVIWQILRQQPTVISVLEHLTRHRKAVAAFARETVAATAHMTLRALFALRRGFFTMAIGWLKLWRATQRHAGVIANVLVWQLQRAASWTWHVILRPLLSMARFAAKHTATAVCVLSRTVCLVLEHAMRRLRSLWSFAYYFVRLWLMLVYFVVVRSLAKAREAVFSALCGAGRHLATLWRQKLTPLLRTVWLRFIVPVTLAAVMTLRRLGACTSAALYLAFPYFSCAVSLYSCCSFCYGAYTGTLRALANFSVDLASETVADDGGYGSYRDLMRDLLFGGGAPLLGASAAGSVALMLAGDAAGITWLRALGARCMLHSDLGLVSASRWMTYRAWRVACGAARYAAIMTRSVSRAFLTLAHELLDHVSLALIVVWRCARRMLLLLLLSVQLMAERLVLRPFLIVWRSPAAALVASASVAISAYWLHAAGAWGRALTLAGGSPGAAYAFGMAVLRAPPALLATDGKGSLAARAATTFLVGAVRTGGSAAATQGRLVLALVGSIAEGTSLDAAFASTTSLHASPTFSFLVWAFVVAVVTVSKPSGVPPKAVAAGQLIVAIVTESFVVHRLGFFSTRPTMSLVLVMLLAAMYMCAAAAAADERRHARQEREEQLREARTALMLRSAPKPKRIYSTETCVICLEDLDDGTGGEDCTAGQQAGTRTQALPCGHQFHRNCVRTWLASSASKGRERCPTCREPIDMGRRALERALFLSGE